LWTVQGPIKLVREVWAPVFRYWEDMSKALTSLAADANLLFTGQLFQEIAANVAEHYEIPLTALHYYPMRPNGQYLPVAPPVARSAMKMYDRFCWRMSKDVENNQRRALGLPPANCTSAQRFMERQVLEIQAYYSVFFPGLAAEWAKVDALRPVVGALTMELPTDADEEVASWIAAGKPPICFAFGSMDVPSPAATVEMVSSACAQLGERALICSGWSKFSDVPHPSHVKVVGVVNYAGVFPACRAVVHHGGSGTTHACLRAGVPALVLWTAGDQPFWGARLKRLGVGLSQRFSEATTESLVADLRLILSPRWTNRTRELAGQMVRPTESVSRAADLVEDYARSKSPI
jgi:UDP:flavonoid glycosyltransferase YjiC (YdhE family)